MLGFNVHLVQIDDGISLFSFYFWASDALSHSFDREAGTYKLDKVFCKSRLHRLIHGQIILPLL